MLSRCSHCLRDRLYWGKMGAVGRAGPGWFLWTECSFTVPHDFHWQHLGLLQQLRRFQVTVHDADNYSNVRVSSHIRVILYHSLVFYCRYKSKKAKKQTKQKNSPTFRLRQILCLQVSDCSWSLNGKICTSLWGKYLWSTGSTDDYHVCCSWQ